DHSIWHVPGRTVVVCLLLHTTERPARGARLRWLRPVVGSLRRGVVALSEICSLARHCGFRLVLGVVVPLTRHSGESRNPAPCSPYFLKCRASSRLRRAGYFLALPKK